MLDVRRIRTDFDAVEAGLSRRGGDTKPLHEVRALDERHRVLAAEADEVRHRIKALSGEVGRLRRDGDVEGAEKLQVESRRLGDDERALAADVETLAAQIRDLLLTISNVPAPDCPDGAGEHDNVVLRVVAEPGVSFELPDPPTIAHERAADPPREYADHQRVPHWDIGTELGILDVERAVKMSGSMFVMYRGAGAALVRALVQLALDRNADVFEEIRPPTLVLTETMVSTGHLPKFEEDAYQVERDGLWAIPTAEVPLTSLARDEILTEAELPKRLMAHTSCFRREAGSAGRDTRGLLRVHEFDKVEILAYGRAAEAAELHAELLARAEGIIADLGLAYRILDLCTGDLGNSAARTFDIEVYAPGVGQWLECSSVSWFTDYQARRANVRYRPEGGKGTELVHTFNGSALAVPRVWAALVETYRQPDGTVVVPELLRPYMRGLDRIG